MSKFTPGPWAVDETEDGHIIRMGEAIESPYEFATHLVIEYDHGCFYDNDFSEDAECNQQALEAEANAQLISAAPDMYEALEECLVLFALGVNAVSKKGNNVEDKRDKAREIEHKVLSALAKARGESS